MSCKRRGRGSGYAWPHRRTRNWQPVAICGIVVSLLLVLIAPTQPVGAALMRVPPAPLIAREYILIDGDGGFTFANGVVAGTGTASDPYIIDGWDVSKPSCGSWLEPMGIVVRNTRASFVIRHTSLRWDAGCSYDMALSNTSNGRVENGTFWDVSLHIYSSSNMQVWDSVFPHGGRIRVASSSDITVGRNVLKNTAGTWSRADPQIEVRDSTRVLVVDNVVHSRGPCEICLESTSFANLSGNRLDLDGIGITGDHPEHFASHTITPDNLVNGAPVLYVRDRRGFALSGGAYGQVILANVSSVILWGLSYGNTSRGLQVAYADNVLVFGNRANDRELPYVYSFMGPYATVMTFTHARGLQVVGNIVLSSELPLWIDQSENVTIRGNNLTAENGTAVVIQTSRNVTVTQNNFIDIWRTVWIQGSENVTVYRNNFIRFGTTPMVVDSTRVAFDHGYPDGGNYWDDFRGMDNCRGPTQLDCEESDGIGDVWYIINATLEDRFPLMHPATADTGVASGGTSEGLPAGVILLVSLPLAAALVVVLGFVLLRRRRRELARKRRKEEGPRLP